MSNRPPVKITPTYCPNCGVMLAHSDDQYPVKPTGRLTTPSDHLIEDLMDRYYCQQCSYTFHVRKQVKKTKTKPKRLTEKEAQMIDDDRVNPPVKLGILSVELSVDDVSKSDLNDNLIKSLVNAETVDGFYINTSNIEFDITMDLLRDMIKETRPYWTNPFDIENIYWGMSQKNYDTISLLYDPLYNHTTIQKTMSKNDFDHGTLYGLRIIISEEFKDWIYLFPLSSLRKVGDKIIIVRFKSIARRLIKNE